MGGGIEFTAQETREAVLKKFNTITVSGRWTKKDPSDARLITLLSVSEKRMASKASTTAPPGGGRRKGAEPV